MAEDGISVTWEGLKQVLEAFDHVSEQADEAAREIVARSAAVAEQKIKSHFSGSHPKGRPHVGGSEPNVVSGTLRRSVRADPVTKVGDGVYGTLVGPRTVYARRVELGYLASRGYPFVRPGYDDARPLMQAIQVEVARAFLTKR